MHIDDGWIGRRIAYIEGLRAPSDQQRLLLELIRKPALTAEEKQTLAVVLRAEKAAETAVKARGDAARLLDAERKAVRKARDHELYLSAGLLITAGLVDSTTGKPVCDPVNLLGALIAMARSDDGIQGFTRFREVGRRAMHKKQSRKTAGAPSPQSRPEKTS